MRVGKPRILRIAPLLLVAAGLGSITPSARSAPVEAAGPVAVTSRVSLGPGGAQAHAGGPAFSAAPSVSGDGRIVAFTSDAANLVAGDTNGLIDVFIHDRITGDTRRVSVATGGAQTGGAEADGPSSAPVISADGKLVAFVSTASNLVPGDTNGVADVFLRVLATDVTVRVSSAPAGGVADGPSGAPALSADGAVAVFASDASNLVAGDTNRATDIFRWDRNAGTTTRVSVDTGNGDANGPSRDPAVSGDGLAIAFSSAATDILAGDDNGVSDIFVREGNDPAIRVNAGDAALENGGIPTGGDSTQPALSADGALVAYTSGATNLVEEDTNGVADVFLAQRTGNSVTTTRLSRGPAGAQADRASQAPAISDDGAFVSFLSDATNLAGDDGNAPDTNGAADVFVRDVDSQTTTRASVGPAGPAAGPSTGARLSADGKAVVFASSDNLAGPPPTRSLSDVYLRDLAGPATERVSVPSGGGLPDGPFGSSSPSLAAGGRVVAYGSFSPDLVAGDTNRASDIFVTDRESGVTTRVSVVTGGAQANGDSTDPVLSADGRWVAFTSEATNLAAGGGGEPDTNGAADIFVHDRETGQTARVSLDGSTQLPSASCEPAISAKGDRIAFSTRAEGLTCGGDPGPSLVRIRNRELATTMLVSVNRAGAPSPGAWGPSLSGDGLRVAFTSTASDLVDGDTNTEADVFLARFAPAGSEETVAAPPTVIRISVGEMGHQASGASTGASLSSNGRVVAFTSDASDLVPGDTNDATDVFVRDGVSGLISRVSIPTGATQAAGASEEPALSGDGQSVAFVSDAPDMAPGGPVAGEPRRFDIFLHERATARTTRVSVGTTDASPGPAAPDGPSAEPALAVDGRAVAFASEATNLVAPEIGDTNGPDTNGTADVFVRDRRPAAFSSYWLVATDGGIFAYGGAPFFGSTGDVKLNKPIVGMARTPSGAGYWFVASDGGIFSYGDAFFAGSLGSTKLNAPIIGMAGTPSGAGYWLVASDGGIFSFGGAPFAGSTGGTKLNKPIVGITPTPSGAGYWLVASDGGIFSFGDAAFFGSTGAVKLNSPIVGMASTPTGAGYWLVAADGGIFAFGDARFAGSTGAVKLNSPIRGMAPSPSGLGYWLVAADGGIFAFGDARFAGSAGSVKLNAPIVGLAPA